MYLLNCITNFDKNEIIEVVWAYEDVKNLCEDQFIRDFCND